MDAINGLKLKNMLILAAHNLEEQKEYVNALNVFPVPDGDTGTNMSLTLNAAIKELERAKGDEVRRITSLLARGSLMGARGNSGVILSQFFRGFSDGLASVKDQAGATGEDMARAFVMSSQTTYRAVMKPVEGTMLTVARVASEYAERCFEEGGNAEEVVKAALEGAKIALDDTPNILPVLKEAGVVDAGGQGLLCIYEGLVMGLTATEEEIKGLLSQTSKPILELVEKTKITSKVLKNKYCTEFIILGDRINTEKIKKHLEPRGESMIVVGDDEVCKVHIHTDNPGEVLQFCGNFGNLTEIAIDNMLLQAEEFGDHEENHTLDYTEEPSNGFVNNTPGEHKNVGLVAVVPGEGLAEIYVSLGVDYVVLGGQTMNPSTEDLVKAVESINADSVIILPNNKNVIFSAQQVKELTDKPVGVVTTRSTPQGISALMNYVPENSLDENVTEMESAIKDVKTGEITFAVRSTVAGDLQIEERDIIGLSEGKITVVGASTKEVAVDLIGSMIDDDSSVISIYYGQDEELVNAEELLETVESLYPDCEVELYNGGQPLYYYIVSVE